VQNRLPVRSAAWILATLAVFFDDDNGHVTPRSTSRSKQTNSRSGSTPRPRGTATPLNRFSGCGTADEGARLIAALVLSGDDAPRGDFINDEGPTVLGRGPISSAEDLGISSVDEDL
jgi:hypothetical protein